jgi:ABC-type uncharacterized transport system ATPase subunit
MAGNSTVLDIKDVSVCFDGFYALTEVNAAVKRHSIHFFIGPNGAGKTTLLDIIQTDRRQRDLPSGEPRGCAPDRYAGV